MLTGLHTTTLGCEMLAYQFHSRLRTGVAPWCRGWRLVRDRPRRIQNASRRTTPKTFRSPLPVNATTDGIAW